VLLDGGDTIINVLFDTAGLSAENKARLELQIKELIYDQLVTGSG